jgi:hypothetical protein
MKKAFTFVTALTLLSVSSIAQTQPAAKQQPVKSAAKPLVKAPNAVPAVKSDAAKKTDAVVNHPKMAITEQGIKRNNKQKTPLKISQGTPEEKTK